MHEHTELFCTSSGLRVIQNILTLEQHQMGLLNGRNGLVEIKCPYKYKQSHPHNVVDSKFCLEHVNGQIHLKKTHQYYLQIQEQLAICEMEYCDFVCWMPHGMHIECILPDTLFETIKPALDTFF